MYIYRSSSNTSCIRSTEIRLDMSPIRLRSTYFLRIPNIGSNLANYTFLPHMPDIACFRLHMFPPYTVYMLRLPLPNMFRIRTDCNLSSLPPHKFRLRIVCTYHHSAYILPDIPYRYPRRLCNLHIPSCSVVLYMNPILPVHIPYRYYNSYIHSNLPVHTLLLRIDYTCRLPAYSQPHSSYNHRLRSDSCCTLSYSDVSYNSTNLPVHIG